MTEIFLTDELTDQDKLDELRIIREKSINFGANINPIESAKNLPQSFIDVISKTVWVSLEPQGPTFESHFFQYFFKRLLKF